MNGLGRVYSRKIPVSSFSNSSKFDIIKSGARITKLSSKRAIDFVEMYHKEIRKFSIVAQIGGKVLLTSRKSKRICLRKNLCMIRI